MEFDAIYDHDCTRCSMHREADKVCVGGRGATEDIQVMVVGEAPGPEEDKVGSPFIGPAGKKLVEYMEMTGFDMDRVRFENLARCWPQNVEGNTRPPTKPELAACVGYLYKVLHEIAEKQDELPIIVALGKTSLEALTGRGAITRNSGAPFPIVPYKGVWVEETETGKVRHKLQDLYSDLPEYTVVGVIHPAAVLRGHVQYERPILTALEFAQKLSVGKATEYWANYKWIDSIAEFAEWVDEIIERFESGDISEIAFDKETTSLEWYRDNEHVVALSYCADPGKAIIIPYYHCQSPWFTKEHKDDISLRSLRSHHRRLVSKVPCTGWNLGFDLKWSWKKFGHGFEIAFDGQLAHTWFWGERKNSHDLDTAARDELQFFGHGIGVDKKGMYDTGSEGPFGMIRYAGGDTDASLQLCRSLRETMDEYGMLDEFRHVMMRGIKHVCRMEQAGVRVNAHTTTVLAQRLPAEMDSHYQIIKKTSWGSATAKALSARRNWEGKSVPLEFNLGSIDATLRYLIYKSMKLPIFKTSHKQDMEVGKRKRATSDPKAVPSLLSFLRTVRMKGPSGAQLKEMCENLSVGDLREIIKRWKSGMLKEEEREMEIAKVLDNPALGVFINRGKRVVALASTDKEVLPALIDYCVEKGQAHKKDLLENLQKWRETKDEYTGT